MTPAAPITRNWTKRPGISHRLERLDLGIQLDLTRIRRTHQETHGLFSVRVSFRGAKTIGATGLLSAADFNLSSLRTRQERAKHLTERANTNGDLDWLGIIEEFCVNVLEAEDAEDPDVCLSDIPVPNAFADDEWMVMGSVPLLRRHPVIWFGDGGCGKSYLALYAAVDLVNQGERVLYCDWEFAGEDHRRRLARLVGPVSFDGLYYMRCDIPLVRSIDRIRETLERRHATYLICDSIGFAVDGAPESAEAATGYFRGVRELGARGSLHLAHMNRSDQGDQKPFGSVFYNAAARATWYLKRTKDNAQQEELTVGMFNRKANIGRLRSPIGLALKFIGTETHITPTDLIDHEEFASSLPLRQRLTSLLRDGPMSLEAISDELSAKPESIKRLLRRHGDEFQKLSNGAIAWAGPSH